MKDFDHLLSVWQGQPKSIRLSVDDVLKQVKKGVGSLKSRIFNKLIIMGIVLAVILSIMLFIPFHNKYSYIGLGIWAVSMIYFLVISAGDYHTISTLDATADPATYISHLKLYKRRRAFTNGRFFYYYALAISIGLLFYSIEFISKAALILQAGFGLIWCAYLVYVIFFWKKKVFQKESEQIKELLEQLGNLQQQFE